MPNPLEIDPVIGYAIPFFALFVLLELYLYYRKFKKTYDIKDGASSVGMGLGSVFINLLVKSLAYWAFLWLYDHSIFHFGGEWWVWLILFFAEDFTFYCHHRMCHEVRLFWAGHVNHHSSKQINLAVALRQSWGELLHKYILWAWLPFLGFHPLMVITTMSISLIYQFFQHTELVKKLGPLEWILNTPSHHRVHHAKNVRYMDRNHAGILIIWDRLFGTFQVEREKEPVVFGITTDINTYNLFDIAFHEYRNMSRDVKNAPTFKAKLGYIFMPPGWSHDGSTQTANEMREDLEKNEAA